MRIHTASEGVTFAKLLESETASFYENVGRSHAEMSPVFAALAAENRTTICQIERTYYGVISDAMESGFCFDLETADFTLKLPTQSVVLPGDAIRAALGIEQTLGKFYEELASQSEQLMADLPRLFARISGAHGKRVERLRNLLDEYTT